MSKGRFLYELNYYSNYTSETCDVKQVDKVEFEDVIETIERFAGEHNGFAVEGWREMIFPDKPHSFVFFNDKTSIGVHRVYEEF